MRGPGPGALRESGISMAGPGPSGPPRWAQIREKWAPELKRKKKIVNEIKKNKKKTHFFDVFQLRKRFWILPGGPLDPLNRYKNQKKKVRNVDI